MVQARAGEARPDAVLHHRYPPPALLAAHADVDPPGRGRDRGRRGEVVTLADVRTEGRHRGRGCECPRWRLLGGRLRSEPGEVALEARRSAEQQVARRSVAEVRE